MGTKLARADAIAIAQAVVSGQATAASIMQSTIERISAHDPLLNCFTQLLTESALGAAAATDAALASGKPVGPLAGVPFAVKNLFDINGLTTLAGARIQSDAPPAGRDATAIARLQQAGAILVGALNMDEYAYGFVTENHHFGATRNPHDPDRIAGGSSGGAAAAVAAGLVPITLGSDTNGSIRVPASFCGVFGLKPTYGRLSRSGTFLFSTSLDHIGPFARSVRDIAIAFDLLQGPDATDPVCTQKPPHPCFPNLDRGVDDLTIAIADGYFSQGMVPEVRSALELVAKALEVSRRVVFPEAQRARAAAYIITACEGSNLHLPNLKVRPQDFDPATRDRFLAGALLPSNWYLQAQRFRRWYQRQVLALFEEVDLILAPTTPCPAPGLGQEEMVIGSEVVKTRPNLGLYTQPLSFIGLPVLSVPIQQAGQLPVGVQIIAAPHQEEKILQAAAVLEKKGALSGAIAPNFVT